jgi:retinol dehydrogenase 12
MDSMTGKTVLVTGATNGIGFITALELAKMDAVVLMVARDEKKGRAKLEEIRKTVPNAKLELLLADLSSMASIRQLATNITAKYSSLDVLVNNAGAFYSDRRVSKDGFEMTFALNHIGYFLHSNAAKTPESFLSRAGHIWLQKSILMTFNSSKNLVVGRHTAPAN